MSVTNARGLQNPHLVDHDNVETLPGIFLVYFCVDWYFYASCCVEKGTWAAGSWGPGLEMSNNRLLERGSVMAGPLPAFKAAGQQVQAKGRVQLSREPVSQSQCRRVLGEPAVLRWWGAAMLPFWRRAWTVTPLSPGQAPV